MPDTVTPAAVLPSVRAQASRLLALGVHELAAGTTSPLQAQARDGDDAPGSSLLAVHPRPGRRDAQLDLARLRVCSRPPQLVRHRSGALARGG